MGKERSQCREEEWVDHVVWSEVPGLCGFSDWGCERNICGASILITEFTQALGRLPIHKKCWPVSGQNSLDADVGGYAMLMSNLVQWVDKCTNDN